MVKLSIKIHGIVQGVGFRPFIHKLVSLYGIKGFINNTSSGVEMELEGEKNELERFTSDIRLKAPKLAVIEKIETSYSTDLTGFRDFEIRQSKVENSRNTLISPDICVCDDCLKELFDVNDRRYRYPFINCTNCGPRFTIIKDVPYDRVKTSMASFPMCGDCDREYHDINDRRYHAQPDACKECGPHVFLLSGGRTVNGDDEAIEEARKRIKNGEIVAVKGIGGIHLACTIEKAGELRKRKQRDEKPFAIMCRNVDCIKDICTVSEAEERILTGFRRPIVLLKKKNTEDPRLLPISENSCVGVMLPYTPLHYLLFSDDIDMLVMTSANISETPIIYKNEEATDKLRGIADAYLLNNRDIQTRCDDSLCYVYEGEEYFLRRSRGYAPFPVKLQNEMPQLLSLGAEQKASFCMSKGNYVFPSQHIGDLKNIETYQHYVSQIDYYKRLFDISPVAAACDLHPDYMSSEYARTLGIDVVKVQHHHAHMASCMADNNLYEDVIGLIWDGTGLGTDGTIWGSECLIGGYKSFERFSSILPIPLIGGDKAVKDLDRVAYSMLCKDDNEVYNMMLKDKINCPLSSGMGRLFDGAASILDFKHIASYEGQGAVLLEAAADESVNDAYTLEFKDDNFDWHKMALELAGEKNKSKGAAKFMNTIIEMALVQVKSARDKSGISNVVLSGGTFQNMYIMKRLPQKLKDEGFKVYTHRRVSTNDEGISLGQLCVLQYRLR